MRHTRTRTAGWDHLGRNAWGMAAAPRSGRRREGVLRASGGRCPADTLILAYLC